MTAAEPHMLDRSLRNAGHVRRFVIEAMAPAGWEVREEEDTRVIRSVRYTDWHRVERARTLIGLAVSDLAHDGWIEI